jgi:hypothetical protein
VLVIYLAPLPRGFLFGLGTLALCVPKIRFAILVMKSTEDRL